MAAQTNKYIETKKTLTKTAIRVLCTTFSSFRATWANSVRTLLHNFTLLLFIC